MKPKITFKCWNEKCPKYDIEIERESHFGIVSDECEECKRHGRLLVKHKSLEGSSIEEFSLTAAKMGLEYSLLKRIVDGKIGTEEDAKRVAEIKELIDGLQCPCCEQNFLKEE